MFNVYILYSAKLDRYYIGFTNGPVAARLKKHLANHKGFTGKNTDWQIVYSEKYNEKKDAINREQQIKSWKSRKMIEKLIRSTE